MLGLEIQGDKLLTSLPASEVIKPLRRVVRDLANATINVTKLKLKEQQVDYVHKLGSDLPDLTKATPTRVRVESLTDSDFGKVSPAKPAIKQRVKRTPERKNLIPSTCGLRVTNGKIAEIEKELRSLPLVTYPHAISVLLRVFLEQSTDHYLTAHGIPLTVPSTGSKGGANLKSLKSKVQEAVHHMISTGADKKSLDGVSKSIHDKNSPLNADTLNNYVHNAFYSPQERES